MTVSLDDGGDSISVDSVHVDSATSQPRKRQMSITAAKRASLPKREFAIPSQNKYPIDTAARTRNAAARLEQNKGSLSPSEYSAAKSRIAAAAKKFGIQSEYNKPKARGMSGGRGLNMKIGADGSMHIRHMEENERSVAFLPLQPILTPSEAVTMSDAAPKLVWNKLAVSGTFMGHPSGPFKMDAQTFSQIVKNFNHDGIKVPFDYEHASEQPVAGNAPKGRGDVIPSGWIHKLDARQDGLYGAVEWLPEARKKILAGEFKYISPAVRFGATDGVTGKDVGAKLSSAAIVLKPFLKSLPEIRAADAAKSLQMSEQPDGTEIVFLCTEITQPELVTLASSGGYAMHQNQFLPAFRRMLGMDDLSSPSDMLDKVDRLSELCDMADGDPSATVEGVNLGNYIPQMRSFMSMPANTTLGDLLEAVAEMIGSSIQCEDMDMSETVNNDSEGADMTDTVSVEAPQRAEPTAPVLNSKKENKEMSENTISMADHETKVSSAVASATAPLTLQLSDVNSKLTVALSEKTAAEAKIVELTDQIKKQTDAVSASRVEDAFETYKEAKKLSDSDKKAMGLVLASDPALFDTLYPKLSPAKAVLLRTVTASDTGTQRSTEKTVPALKTLIAKAIKENPNSTYDEQFSMAYTEHATLMAAGQ